MRTLSTRSSVHIILVSLLAITFSLSTIYKHRHIDINKEHIDIYQANKIDDYSDEDKPINSSLYDRAVILCKESKFDDSIKVLQKHIKLFPKHAQAYYLLGRIYEDNI